MARWARPTTLSTKPSTGHGSQLIVRTVECPLLLGEGGKEEVQREGGREGRGGRRYRGREGGKEEVQRQGGREGGRKGGGTGGGREGRRRYRGGIRRERRRYRGGRGDRGTEGGEEKREGAHHWCKMYKFWKWSSNTKTTAQWNDHQHQTKILGMVIYTNSHCNVPCHLSWHWCRYQLNSQSFLELWVQECLSSMLAHDILRLFRSAGSATFHVFLFLWDSTPVVQQIYGKKGVNLELIATIALGEKANFLLPYIRLTCGGHLMCHYMSCVHDIWHFSHMSGRW